MQNLLKVLAHRYVISAVGLLALALIIWFVGPLIGIADSRPLESITARLIAILLIVLLALAVEIVRLVRTSRAASKLGAGIAAQDDAGDRPAEEVAALKKRFEEAVEVLRKTAGKGRGGGLYGLPWYIIIGPPGSGKTTALANSGLRFPLAERFGKEALRGVGGTRNCDWWFTDEAILLDTAGRYTTQDSDAHSDRAAWQGFLDLLKRYRRRRPINGVLVALSLADLMLLSDQERFAHARAIRQRILELDAHFKMRFPVYVLLTKSDLVAGFTEYFDGLNAEERAQVWGFTRELADKEETIETERLASAFDELLERLESRLLSRLHAERDPARRRLIFGFPRQIAGLRGPVTEFIKEVFAGSKFDQAPLLRGVYFTSGTQEGTPIDRLMGALARTFGLGQQALPSFAGRGRSYFITRLLRDVIFPEAEIAGTNRRLERQRAWLQRSSYVGLACLVVLAIAGWFMSFRNNVALATDVDLQVGQAEELIGEAAGQGRDPAAVKPVLDLLRGLPGGAGAADAARPFLTGLGLYQGDKLGPQSREAYRRVLVSGLLPRMIYRLEEQIGRGEGDLAATYEALKVYLMLDSPEHYNKDSVTAWFRLDWERNRFPEWGQETFEGMVGHLEALLETRPSPLPVNLDADVVATARARVAAIPLEERIYVRLRDFDLDKGIQGFSIRDAAGPEAGAVFARVSGQPLTAGLPGFYTLAAYQRIFQGQDSLQLIDDLLKEQWVLKEAAPDLSQDELRALLVRVKDLYLQDYAKVYDELIRDVRLLPFDNAEQGARILNVASKPAASPLQKLLEGLKRETSFCAPQEAPAAAEAGTDATKPDDTADPYARLRRILGGSEPAAGAGAGPGLAECDNPVEQRFGALNAQPVEQTLGLLAQLADLMMTVKQSPGGTPDPGRAADGARTVDQVRMEAERTPDPLGGVLQAAAGNSASVAFGGVRKGLNEQWLAGPLRFCETAIAGRFPLTPGSTKEVSLADFGRFFGMGGLLDQFFQTYAREMVDMSRSPWRSRAAGGIDIRLSPAAIAMFERGAMIRDAFFQSGMQPGVSFELVPVGMDASINEFKLTLDGQAASYFNGPIVPQLMQWPGPGGTGEVRLEMSPANGPSMRWERGPWAWFRVLEDSGLRSAGTPERFNVTFTLGGRSARYELVARSAFNPFQSTALQQFRCVLSLTG